MLWERGIVPKTKLKKSHTSPASPHFGKVIHLVGTLAFLLETRNECSHHRRLEQLTILCVKTLHEV